MSREPSHASVFTKCEVFNPGSHFLIYELDFHLQSSDNRYTRRSAEPICGDSWLLANESCCDRWTESHESLLYLFDGMIAWFGIILLAFNAYNTRSWSIVCMFR